MATKKLDANRGDLFEAFFAAAVAARFVKRAKMKTKKKLPNINGSDVDIILTEMMKGGYQRRVNDVGSAVMDTVSVSVAIPEKASTFLKNKNNWATVSDLKQGAISFANSHSRLNAQARGLSINERQDLIRIVAQGTTNQRGTKADVTIDVESANKIYKNINYSLKVTGGEQFHQVSGMGFDKFLDIFGANGLGVIKNNQVNYIRKKYEKDVQDFFDTTIYTKKYVSREAARATGGLQKLASSATVVYEYVYKKMKTILETEGLTDEKTKVADYIIKGVGGGVSTELVKFDSKTNSTLSRIGNKEFRDILAASTYTVAMGGGIYPQIDIKVGNQKILNIRYRMEVASSKTTPKTYTFYPRHYLETGEGFFNIGK